MADIGKISKFKMEPLQLENREVPVPVLSSYTTKRVIEKKPRFANEIIENLFLGNWESADEQLLLKLNIKSVVNVTKDELRYSEDSNIQVFQIPIDDDIFEEDNLRMYRANIGSALKFIHAALVAGQKVLVHCQAGISRSASVVCAYLETYREYYRDELAGEEVLYFVTNKKNDIDPKFFPLTDKDTQELKRVNRQPTTLIFSPRYHCGTEYDRYYLSFKQPIVTTLPPALKYNI